MTHDQGRNTLMRSARNRYLDWYKKHGRPPTELRVDPATYHALLDELIWVGGPVLKELVSVYGMRVVVVDEPEWMEAKGDS